jgi:hypothetical protein
MQPVLHVGSAWSSSWSVVGWMACRLGGIDPELSRIFLSRPESPALLAAVSPRAATDRFEPRSGSIRSDISCSINYVFQSKKSDRMVPSGRILL